MHFFFKCFCNRSPPETVERWSDWLCWSLLTGAVAVGAYGRCGRGRRWIRVHRGRVVVLRTAGLNGSKVTMAAWAEACGHGHVRRLAAAGVRMHVLQLVSVMLAQLHVSHLLTQRRLMWAGMIEKEQWRCMAAFRILNTAHYALYTHWLPKVRNN